jgi:hypothetical protein
MEVSMVMVHRLPGCFAAAAILALAPACGSSSSTTTSTAAPTITSFSTPNAQVDNTLTITGSGFTGTTAVTFGGIAASSFSVAADTELLAVIPYNAVTGPVSVTASGGSVTSAASFVIEPVINGLSQNSGPVGTWVTLSGSGFLGTSTVTFGGAAAPIIPGTTTANGITVQVPSAAVTGNIDLTCSGMTTVGPLFTVN